MNGSRQSPKAGLDDRAGIDGGIDPGHNSAAHYTLSASRLVFGAEPVSAFAAARFDPATGVDMTTAALLEIPGGRLALCESSFEAHFQSRLLAVGTGGTLLLDRAFSAKDFDVALAIVRGDVREAVRVSRADMFRLMAEHFADAVLGREPLRVPVADALGNAHTLDACFGSIRTGRRTAVAGSFPQGGIAT